MQLVNLPHIKNLLANGKTSEALAELHAKLKEQSPEWEEAVIMLQANWRSLEEQTLTGVLSNEDAERQRNRINAGVLKLTSYLESGKALPKEGLQELKSEFFNPQNTIEIEKQEQNTTRISGSNIRVEGSSDVLIGSGNTLNKKIFNALGRRQFWVLLIGLIGIIAGGYFGGHLIMSQQDATLASISNMKQELINLAKEKGGDLEQQLPALQDQLTRGMSALKKENYTEAIQELEQVAQKAPLASVYKNLAYAYEQKGNIEKTYEMRAKAREIDPSLYPKKSPAELTGKRINLLAQENGGEIVAYGNSGWDFLIDGNLREGTRFGEDWVIFSFMENQAATIDQIDCYIGEKQFDRLSFEVLIGNDILSGEFTSVGNFEVFNGYLKETPFQEFKFPAVKTKYVKLQLPGSYARLFQLYEIRIWGVLE